MSTTEQDFDKLRRALKNNNVEEVKKILEKFDVMNAIDRDGSNCLMVCCDADSPEAIRPVLEKIVVEATGTTDDPLQSQLAAKTKYSGWNFLKYICHYSSSGAVMKFFAALLVHFDLFKQQYENINDDNKEKLIIKHTRINSSSWTPDHTSLAEVEILLGGAYLIAALQNNQHSKMKEILKKNGLLLAKKILDSKFDEIRQLVCSEPRTTVETMKVLFSEIKHICDGGGDIKQEYLKNIFSKEDADRGSGLLTVCFSNDAKKIELIIDTIEEVCGEEFLAEQISKKRQRDGMTCLFGMCKTASNYDSLSSVLVRTFCLLDRVGGKALLKSLLTVRNDNDETCLMYCGRYSSSPEVMKLVFEKIVEVGGNELLKGELEATDYADRTCLMVSCMFSSSPEVMELVFEKIVEVGGTELLIRQLEATDSDGRICLMIGCSNSSFPEVVKLVLHHILKAGGEALLNRQLTATDLYDKNCVILSCRHSSSSSVRMLLASLLFHVGLFREQFANVWDRYDKKTLAENTGIDSSYWTPWTSEPEIKTIKVLFSDIKRIGGDQFLKEVLSRDTAGGESCLLSICLGRPRRLELVLDTIEEVGGEEFLAEQVAKRRRSDDTSCISALCKNAPRLSSLSLLVGKICQLVAGRRFLKQLLNVSDSCFDCIFSSPHAVVSAEEGKVLLFISCLYSMTGLFEFQYSRLDNEKKEKLRQLCKIQSGDWTRAQSVASSMNNEVGNIKKRIQNCN